MPGYIVGQLYGLSLYFVAMGTLFLIQLLGLQDCARSKDTGIRLLQGVVLLFFNFLLSVLFNRGI